MNKTSIEYLDFTWSPVTGCTPVSAGCANCWAKRQHERFSDRPFSEIVLHPERLEQPLRRKKPARIGVCFSGDLWHDKVDDGFIRLVMAVALACPRHTFLILTKRPKRMQEWFMKFDMHDCYVEAKFLNDSRRANHGSRLTATLTCMDGLPGKPSRLADKWPLPNVWLGTSVSNQEDADRNIPLLLQTPAAHRWVSYEPAIAPVDFCSVKMGCAWDAISCACSAPCDHAKLDWLVCGGESGPQARPCDLAWLRSSAALCKAAGVPCFVKQLGARPVGDWFPSPQNHIQISAIENGGHRLIDRSGGNPDEWPEDLRVRELPI